MNGLFFATAVLLGTEIVINEAKFSFDFINVTKAVHYINSQPDMTWTAGYNGLKGIVKKSDLKNRCGLLPYPTHNKNSSRNLFPNYIVIVDNLPKSYDCRIAFPQCRTISTIRSQASGCNSCWAESIASAFSDRVCIHSKGENDHILSADQLTACDKKSKGCDGGYLESAWEYIESRGVVNENDYKSIKNCRNNRVCCKIPSTMKTYKATNTRHFSGDEHEIRREIYRNGPVVAGFEVFYSLFSYKTGIYRKLMNDRSTHRGHAVRIVGWGEEKSLKYWLMANSWGTVWGEKGMFRMIRGAGEFGLLPRVLAGLPKL